MTTSDLLSLGVYYLVEYANVGSPTDVGNVQQMSAKIHSRAFIFVLTFAYVIAETSFVRNQSFVAT